MIEKTAGLAYDNMAWFYNQYWGGRYINKLWPVLEKLIFSRIPESATILDLCCGTGQLASHLNERGYRVYGVDNAAAMLEYARMNAPNAQFIHSDAQSFTLPEEVHAIFSTFDSLNHVESVEELAAVFRAVYRALLPGGLFLFDLNMEEAFQQKWKGSFSIDKPDHRLSASSSYSRKAKTGKLEVKMARQVEGEWHRSTATFIEHCFEQHEVLNALNQSGLAVLECGPSAQFGIADAGRLMILAARPAAAKTS